jgi:hypothetical protein
MKKNAEYVLLVIFVGGGGAKKKDKFYRFEPMSFNVTIIILGITCCSFFCFKPKVSETAFWPHLQANLFRWAQQLQLVSVSVA